MLDRLAYILAGLSWCLLFGLFGGFGGSVTLERTADTSQCLACTLTLFFGKTGQRK